MRINITVPGEPVGKGRPRQSRTGRPYTPQRTREYEAKIRAAYYEQAAGQRITGPAELSIAAYFKIPKSATKRTQEAMAAGKVRPTKKPDLDNVIKTIDALNQIAIDDDSHIVKVTAEKYYSYTPRLEITLTPV